MMLGALFLLSRRLSKGLMAIIGTSGRLACFTVLVVAGAASAQDVVMTLTRIPVTIRDETFELETLFAVPAGNGRFPVALITHGASGYGNKAKEMRADSTLGTWAMTFARRGYLAVAVARRGYGLSDGTVAEGEDSCDLPNPMRYFDWHADDLEAILNVVALRSDVDMTRVIGIGKSTGGGALLALSARRSNALSAVISVSGGVVYTDGTRDAPAFDVFRDCQALRPALVGTMALYGLRSRVPTLWLYAENDPAFPPALASDMRNAWVYSGGLADLQIFPPSVINGNNIFSVDEGRAQLLPAIDAFLQKLSLPTWHAEKLDALRRTLNDDQKKQLDTYLTNDSAEKALAMAQDGLGSLYDWSGALTLFRAKRDALDVCRKATKKDCKIIAENFDLPAEREVNRR